MIIDNMKYFLVLLAVVAVFADPRSDSSSEDSQEVDKPFDESQPEIDESFDEGQEVEKSFEDSQQEIGTLNIEDDDERNQQPGKSIIYKYLFLFIFYM